jgi:hypothetical protein
MIIDGNNDFRIANNTFEGYFLFNWQVHSSSICILKLHCSSAHCIVTSDQQ